MMVVIFEVWPAAGRKPDYLAVAASLREELMSVEGFISVERFESLSEEGKLLSLSFWRDEEAVQRWRNRVEHRKAQEAGRGGIFADYRLRVAEVVRDYGMRERAGAPADSVAAHTPTADAGKARPAGRTKQDP
jgi:heme-degrading monooxygenase HmoA